MENNEGVLKNLALSAAMVAESAAYIESAVSNPDISLEETLSQVSRLTGCMNIATQFLMVNIDKLGAKELFDEALQEIGAHHNHEKKWIEFPYNFGESHKIDLIEWKEYEEGKTKLKDGQEVILQIQDIESEDVFCSCDEWLGAEDDEGGNWDFAEWSLNDDFKILRYAELPEYPMTT